MSGDNQETTDAEVSKSLERFQEPGVKRMSGAVYWLTMVMGSFGIFLAINQTFRLDAFGTIIIDNSYYYILIAVFLSLAFLILPGRKKDDAHVPWYDWLLFVLTRASAMSLA